MSWLGQNDLPYEVVNGNPFQTILSLGGVYRWQGKLYITSPRGPIEITNPYPIPGRLDTTQVKLGQVYKTSDGKLFVASIFGPQIMPQSAYITGAEAQKIIDSVIQPPPMQPSFLAQNATPLLVGGGFLFLSLVGFLLFVMTPIE